ncbi:MAG: alpha/beta fold hydrolase [Planctomycetaceae bacterium]|nr:alpha/beta fold hydrolase [Planctomycetaceae bacterium]
MPQNEDSNAPILQRVETADGCLLDGSYKPLSTTASDGLLSRAFGGEAEFLLVHGTGSNFYHPGVLETFADQACVSTGGVWRVNTRGHDGIVSIPGRNGSRPGGATHEVISECVEDLEAWTQRIASKGRRVVLVGHSMGAVKSLYFAAVKKPPAVAAVVAINPPRFCHAVWMRHPRADAFRASWNEARGRVDSGQGGSFLSVTQPVPFVATASGFLAKYGPSDDYDIVRLVPRVICPVLILVGTRSAAASPAFEGLVETLSGLPGRPASCAVQSVEGANTGYAGMESVPFDRVVDWLKCLSTTQ